MLYSDETIHENNRVKGKSLFENHKLDTLTEMFDIPVSLEHRALADCYTTIKCCEYMKTHVLNNGIDLNSYITTP